MKFLVTSRALALIALLVALGAAPAAAAEQPWSWVWSPGGVPVGFTLDLVSVVLLGFVGLLGWVVASYARTNLRGRQRSERTGGALLVALASLLVVVTGASLVMVALGWTASGMAVAILVARSGTPRARAAARVMRRTLLIGDLFLWSGVLAGVFLLPSLERSRLHEIVPGWPATVVAALLLGACVARTGLVPAHRWLPETADGPSPVSALLHAGVVNGAGVLVLLTWPLFSAAPLALAGLLVLGALSLVLGAWAGRVRADVKGRLACSTTTQMGYMCIQLGLGLPAAALMHLVGHGAYKSWLFLRAGGAVTRTRALVVPRSTTSWRRWTAAVLTGGVAVLTGLPATVQLVPVMGVAVLVPLSLSVVAAGLAGHAVVGLDRVNRPVVGGVMTLAGLAGGLYAWILLGGEKAFAPAFSSTQVWSSGVASGLVLVVVLAAVAVVLGCRRLQVFPDSRLAVWLLPTALAPIGRSRATRSIARHLPQPERPAHLIERSTIIAAVTSASKVVGPAWPLRNMVAANPLAPLEFMAFDDALLITYRAHGVTGRPSLPYCLDLFETGRITGDHLRTALEEVRGDAALRVEDTSVTSFVATSQALAAAPAGPSLPSSSTRQVRRFCETLPPSRAAQVTTLVDDHTALWAQRAWSAVGPLYDGGPTAAPDDHPVPGPWGRWRQAAVHPGYDRSSGVAGASEVVRMLPADPARALGLLAGWVSMPSERLVGYLVATLASAPGWSGHAAWRARRGEDPSPLVEWAALRMAHDVLFSGVLSDSVPGPSHGQLAEHSSKTEAGSDDLDQEMLTAHTQVWQRALEVGIEDWLLAEVAGVAPSTDDTCRDGSRTTATPATATAPASQSIWCIDVRSERIRRHLEALGDHRTYGYAGFFGAAVRHLDPDQVSHDCCPALIEPTSTAHEHRAPLRLRQVAHRTSTAVSRHPLGALVIAEAGGSLAAVASTLTTLDPRVMRRLWRSWTQEGQSTMLPGSSADRRGPQLTSDLDLADRVALAAAALRTNGLIDDFAPVILICGHGASPENNAFATAYDCGACGGNDGAVNATLLVDALNDPAVREQLCTQGVVLPHDTLAVAAVHDTTTDQVSLLIDDLTGLSDQTRRHLGEVVDDLRAAGRRAAAEQRLTLPSGSGRETRSLTRRAADWSEPTPEWGLAGNAAILIGPRHLTAGADLQGRVFLHSYERQQDPDGTTLEQLLTAPLVVAQWINAQYYFSAVAPDVFGAGDKTTHNVIGDVGVLRGAHGDLASGLPWQALFRHQPGTRPDSASLVHEPVRLLAAVAADPHHIHRIVMAHPVLRHLVGNQWIHLICLDQGRTLRLRHDFSWQDRSAPRVTAPTSRSSSPTGPDVSDRATPLRMPAAE